MSSSEHVSDLRGRRLVASSKADKKNIALQHFTFVDKYYCTPAPTLKALDTFNAAVKRQRALVSDPEKLEIVTSMWLALVYLERSSNLVEEYRATFMIKPVI